MALKFLKNATMIMKNRKSTFILSQLKNINLIFSTAIKFLSQKIMILQDNKLDISTQMLTLKSDNLHISKFNLLNLMTKLIFSSLETRNNHISLKDK